MRAVAPCALPTARSSSAVGGAGAACCRGAMVLVRLCGALPPRAYIRGRRLPRRHFAQAVWPEEGVWQA